MNPFRLYFVTDPVLMKYNFLDVVRGAINGGVTAVQLREKDLGKKEFVEKARAVKKALEPYKVPLLINDDWEVAIASGADGVHIGLADGCPRKVRKAIGPDKILGLSIEEPLQIQNFPKGIYDYLGVSGIFYSQTKPDLSTHWTLASIHGLKEQATVPLIGIGGINLESLPQIKGWGLDGVAVVSAIANQKSMDKVTEMTIRLKKEIEEVL